MWVLMRNLEFFFIWPNRMVYLGICLDITGLTKMDKVKVILNTHWDYESVCQPLIQLKIFL